MSAEALRHFIAAAAGSNRGTASPMSLDPADSGRGWERAIRRNATLVLLVWSALVAGSATWNVIHEREEVVALAATDARTHINMNLAFRDWTNSHGGFYAPISMETVPNPYLGDLAERDIVTPSGRTLTLITASSVMRHVMDDYATEFGIHTRTTGHAALNPDNAPDAWQREALRALRGPEDEALRVSEVGGAPYLQLMRPRIMDETCTHCHGQSGVPVGQVLGGIDVSIPLTSYYDVAQTSIRNILAFHGAAWVLGVAAVGFISRRARYTATIVRSQERVRLLLDSTAEGIYGVDAEGRCVLVNRAFMRILGYEDTAELLGRDAHAFVHHTKTDGSEYHWEECPVHKAVREGYRTHADKEVFWRKDGTPVPVEYWAYPVSRGGEVVGAVVTFVDVSERLRAEAQLSKLSRAVEQSANAVMITDVRGCIEYVNPKFCEINGYTAGEVIGKTPALLSSGEKRKAVYASMWDTLLRGEEWHGEFHNRRKDGDLYWCLESISPVKDPSGAITHFVAVTEDISARKNAESTIRHLAYFDTLTDLPNRRLFHDRLDQATAEARRSGTSVALLYLDVDRFKTVNDTLGHESGDLLLKIVADRLRACVRAPDTVARLGGDEFGVVLGRVVGADGAVQVAKKIIAGVQRPIQVASRELFVTVSVGISLYPNDAGDIDSLMRKADIAMYRAKEIGRNGFQFFTDSMNAAALERLDIESGLRKALERDELRLLYQPQVDLSNGRLIGVEALLRWMHPSRGVMLPEAFIPVAEDTGQIVAIGDWVLRTACRDLAAWRRDGHRDMRMAVNVSTRQFRQENLPAWVRGVLGDSGVPPDRLELEITETLLMDNSDEAACSLRALRQAGIGVSIDDFGTGYASLSYLKRFPIDVIKIDKSFVSGCTCNPDDRTIVDAVVALGRSLKLRVVAEGVEAADQVSLLRSLHCDVGQGFYFGEPQSAARIAGMLAAGPLAGAPMAA